MAGMAEGLTPNQAVVRILVDPSTGHFSGSALRGARNYTYCRVALTMQNVTQLPEGVEIPPIVCSNPHGKLCAANYQKSSETHRV